MPTLEDERIEEESLKTELLSPINKQQDFKTEFLEIIHKHEMEYDEKYLWD